jgi:hypothetical protein
MKKLIAGAAALAFTAAGSTAANAAAAPTWGAVTSYTASVYGTPGLPGTIYGGDVYLVVDQGYAGSGVGTVSLALGNGLSLTGADVTVTGECTTTNQSVTVSGSVITVKGLSCFDGPDDYSVLNFAVHATNLAGTINAVDFYTGGRIETQYRSNPSRKYKDQSWRYTNTSGLDFSDGCGGAPSANRPMNIC